jgi:hypothetical protein
MCGNYTNLAYHFLRAMMDSEGIMNTFVKRILLWTPRILGILFVLFTSIFALDIFEMRLGFWGTLLGLFMHLLVPTIALAIVVVLAWRREWVGVLGFGGWGIWYLASTRGFDASVYVLIAGIPLLIAMLFLTSWVFRKQIRG